MKQTLELQQSFNFAQMLQGENVPANLQQLQSNIQERQGKQLLQFYVIYLLAFMSGLGAGHGSRNTSIKTSKGPERP